MSLCCAWYQKHATLIKNVYPTGPGEEGPRSSALSLLLFYATSKPQKLPKVGRYIENRVNDDLRKLRYGHVRVSLDIINALLHECKQNISIISNNLLRIILNVLNCPESDLFLPASDTFVSFTVNLSTEDVVDKEFTKLQQRLLYIFCDAASNHSIDYKHNISGLKALEALSMKNYFKDALSNGTSVDLQKVLYSVVINLVPKTTKNSAPVPTMSENSIVDQCITTDDLTLSAEKCLLGVFRNTNALSLKPLFLTVIELLDKEGQLKNNTAFDKTLQFIFQCSPQQYQFVILVTLWELVETEIRNEEKVSMILGLKNLISSGNLAGMTVPELLDNCLKQLEKVTAKLTDETKKIEMALIQTIGSLAIHPAYPNQINEVFGILINKVESTFVNDSNGSPFFLAMIYSLSSVISCNGTSDRRSSIFPIPIEVEYLIPVLKYFRIENPHVRIALLHLSKNIFLKGLQQNHTTGRTEFIDCARNAALGIMHSQNSELSDYAVAVCLLLLIVQSQSFPELVQSIPLLFQVQEYSSTSPNLAAYQKVAITWFVLEYLNSAADFLNLNEVVKYVSAKKHELQQHCKWVPSIDILQFSEIELFSGESKQLKDITILPLDKEDFLKVLKEAPIKEFPNLVIQVERSLSATVPEQNAVEDKRIESMLEDGNRPETAVNQGTEVADEYLIRKRSIRANAKSGNIELEKVPRKEVLSISDFTNISLDSTAILDQTADRTPHVTELLKSINDKLGSEEAPNKVASGDIGEYDLEWLKSRSRQKSNQTGVFLSQKEARPLKSAIISGKRREPPVFDIANEDE